mmetsp:Transcript_43059/g.63090  ORF Transcript_43059/g.63090 Transcript_43059/m.63090 type:complete len:82 (-) Transcript_43059:185-430(-)
MSALLSTNTLMKSNVDNFQIFVPRVCLTAEESVMTSLHLTLNHRKMFHNLSYREKYILMSLRYLKVRENVLRPMRTHQHEK